MSHHHTARWTASDRLDLLGEGAGVGDLALHGCICETPAGWEWTCQHCDRQGVEIDQAAAWGSFVRHERSAH